VVEPDCVADNFFRVAESFVVIHPRSILDEVKLTVSTCSMGSAKENSVVDSRCKVHGIKNLRVVDVSVMPKIIRGNTYLCCVMMGERVSEMIKEDGGNEKGGNF